MTETPVMASSFTFDPFAQHKFYHDVNQSLVHRAIARLDEAHPKGRPVRVVELASGTGAVTELILDELERLGRPGTVIGVEPSPEAIEIASDRLDSRGARFVQGEADSLVRVAPNADAIFFCNAIHLVPDKRVVARQIASALAPNGFFACNSAFYQGTYAPGSEKFYHLWTRRALGWLRKNHPGVRTSRTEKAMAMQWLNPDEYAQAFETSGLHVVDRAEEVALMPLRAWQDIGRYWLFIEGALPGVPIPIGADALEHSAAEAMTELDITEVPRNWLQMVAQHNAQ